ncbi:glutaminyl-tRNA synthetase [Wallemia mellicola CBS 633.66]|nr:glutaminyl-tRNA synthetase [Wallemia mellicola CBS 633.66]EIM19303.1 glutaminyl-tRNA synthetase [Wallemia mellicola CBS 633.66]|eukprot:XP_006960695.1 glutaminyl-tRNA synthetase [Wallemia mellicola CBS 633.66]
MPPKADESLVRLFTSLGLNEAKGVEYAKSKHSKILNESIQEIGLENAKLDEKMATLIASTITVDKQFNGLPLPYKAYIIEKIKNGDLKESNQVTAAVKYLSDKQGDINQDEFNENAGVGIVVPVALIREIAQQSLDPKAKDLPNPWSSHGLLIKSLKEKPELKWSNPLELKNQVDALYTENFGTRDECNKRLKEAAKNAPKPSKESTKKPSQPAVETNIFEQGFLGALHKPGGNPQIKPELRDQHLKATDGKVITRFPPEPNGFLHIGHSKAITVNFGYAANFQGHTYLRYDDTNPEAEEQVYFESILESVRWLGFEPWKITYSSDYFQQLYELAIELIKRGKAYVDHSTGEEMQIQRGGENRGPRVPSPWRERPVEESLQEFENMRLGNYQPGQATLRMKQNIEDGNPQMWDLVAYRVLKAAHHRTGDKWKIYPTYDFTHCLVDSFENISHSLCTTEFVLSRVSYEWLCDALEVYKPRQSEYGRLNMQGTVMSKRKIMKLVKENHVRGWDDPRLYTLIALRRRGVPPSAILSFVKSLGVSTAVSSILTSKFDQSVRDDLESKAPRLMAVIDPIKLVITNVPDDYMVQVKKPFHPKIPEFGEATIPFSKVVYIERSDFRTVDDPNFFRMAPGKLVGLLNAPHPVKCTSFKEENGKVVEITAELVIPNEGEKPTKPKAFIQWVAEHKESNSPVKVNELRIFNQLFKSDNPSAAPDLIADLNPDSEEIIKSAFVDVSLYTLAKNEFQNARKSAYERTSKAKEQTAEIIESEEEKRSPTPKLTAEQLIGNECVRFQALRAGFFALDKDTILNATKEGASAEPHQDDKIVLNRIVSIKAAAS